MKKKKAAPPKRTQKQHDEIASNQTLSIAFALRARRRKLGLTLRELAEQSGLSAPFISQAERGLTTPSIISLMHLARALEVELGYFIDVPKGGRTVRRANDPEIIDLGRVKHVLLSGDLDDPKMEALVIQLEPGVVSPTVRREGEGLFYMLEGTVKFEIEDDTYVLSAGDSAHFDQRLRYKMFNEGNKISRVLWVGTPPLFEHATKKKDD
ncbi:MAG: family transcriptional regulator [Rhodospirillales bacterium]|nr:family transcriptional regulator [Rhodospirillales bacterium]